MNPEKMYADAIEAKGGLGLGMMLVLPPNWKRPPGFPRGEFLSDNDRGEVYSFDPDKMIAWLEKNNLVDNN